MTVPCCGKVFSRHALAAWFARGMKVCPMCKNFDALRGFDVDLAAKSVVIEALVEAAQREPPGQNNNNVVQPRTEHIWSAECNLVAAGSSMAELTVNIEQALFAAKPSLFIAVVDHSGSMSGNPWRQVQTALGTLCRFFWARN